MPITISINGTNAAEVLEELSALATGFDRGSAPVQQELKVESKPTKRSAAKKTESKKEAPETADPVTESEDDSSDNSDEIEVVPSIDDVPTVEQVREKALTKDKTAVRALLDEFGAKNLTTIPEDRRAEFMARLEKL